MDIERQKDGSGLPAFGRRTFLTMAAAAGAAVFLAAHAPGVAAAIAGSDKKILWLERRRLRGLHGFVPERG